MLDDASLLSPGAALTADVCIVGSGAAGITLALALRSSGLNVLLLESGNFVADATLQNFYVGTMTGISTWTLDQARFRGAGGSTNLWAGFCRPLQPEDFTARSYVPGGGWPITYDDLVPYYQRACQTCDIGTFQYDVNKLAAASNMPLLPFNSALVETRVYRFSTVRFGTRYHDDLSAATNVRWLLNGNLLAIRLTGPGGTVSHLDCSTLDGTTFTIEATSYVLALGGIENARLLLASNQEQPEGVANSSGLVGQFLEHPHYYQIGTVAWTQTPDLSFYQQHNVLDDDGVTTVSIQGAVGLPAALRGQNGYTSFTATLDPSTYDFGTTTPITPAVVGPLLPVNGTPSLTRFTCRCEQTALPNSRITLNNDLDALGMRRVSLDWEISNNDRLAVQNSFDYVGREIGRLGLGRVNFPHVDDPNAWVPQPGGHHIGTARMSADPKLGVVDANLQTHDVPNLYVAGSATYASTGDSNPTLTIVALAHRLADHLAGVGT